MDVTMCDRCQREIKDYRDKVRISGSGVVLFGVTFHRRCAQPVVTFLRRLKLLAKEE